MLFGLLQRDGDLDSDLVRTFSLFLSLCLLSSRRFRFRKLPSTTSTTFDDEIDDDDDAPTGVAQMMMSVQ